MRGKGACDAHDDDEGSEPSNTQFWNVTCMHVPCSSSMLARWGSASMMYAPLSVHACLTEMVHIPTAERGLHALRSAAGYPPVQDTKQQMYPGQGLCRAWWEPKVQNYNVEKGKQSTVIHMHGATPDSTTCSTWSHTEEPPAQRFGSHGVALCQPHVRSGPLGLLCGSAVAGMHAQRPVTAHLHRCHTMHAWCACIHVAAQSPNIMHIIWCLYACRQWHVACATGRVRLTCCTEIVSGLTEPWESF